MKIIEIISESAIDESTSSPFTAYEARYILTDMGYKLVRQKGSHEQWRNFVDKHTFPLSVHGKTLTFSMTQNLKKLMKERGYDYYSS